MLALREGYGRNEIRLKMHMDSNLCIPNNGEDVFLMIGIIEEDVSLREGSEKMILRVEVRVLFLEGGLIVGGCGNGGCEGLGMWVHENIIYMNLVYRPYNYPKLIKSTLYSILVLFSHLRLPLFYNY